MTANDRTGVGQGRDDWQTPPELYAALHRRYAFDYDPFASHDNALTQSTRWSGARRRDAYSTVDGSWARAPGKGPHKLSDEDGLSSYWAHRRVFMNPPYSRGVIGAAVEKAHSERNNAEIIVALIPASTDTEWFQQFVLPVCDIVWLSPRVRFINPETGKPGDSPPGGSVVAVFRPDRLCAP